MPTPSFGLTLSSEEHAPTRLVDIAELAQDSGFDFVSISDHFHPWLDAQGHSPFVWAVLGAIAERTETLDVAVGVSCPIMRMHPVIHAHAVATTARLFGSRFTWGVGTGEALNEHVLGDRWPPAPQRLEMLDESLELIRLLLSGDQITFEGRFYTAENAQIYDPPETPLPIIMSAFGPEAAKRAARIADGLWTTGAVDEVVEPWRDAGGTGPVYTQFNVCWDRDQDRALDIVEEKWANGAMPGQPSQDLPTPAHFDMLRPLVRREDLAEQIPCGPDLSSLIDHVARAVDAGADHIYFHQIGDDQEGFCAQWRDVLQAELRALR